MKVFVLCCLFIILPIINTEDIIESRNNIDAPISSSSTSSLSFTSSITGIATSIDSNPVIINNKIDHSMTRSGPSNVINGRCEEITIPMCRGIGYNFTAMPNELNHDTQEEAGLEVHQFWPLVEIKCSTDLKFFLCSMYTPICLPEYKEPLPACKSVCERARMGCAPLMQQYGFSWPERMACERLPNQGDPENLCMEQDNRTKLLSTEIITHSISPVSLPKPTKSSKNIQSLKCKPGKNQKNCQYSHGDKMKDCTCRCRPPLISLVPSTSVEENDELKSFNSLGVSNVNKFMITQKLDVIGISDCVLPCHGAFLTNEEKSFAAVWLTLWSGLCAASTLATVTTFLIDTQRFKYPERPIVFLSACYFLVSLGYLSRIIIGHEEIACDGNMLRHGSQGPGICITVFLLIYFFGMASSVWWVILAFTWFLAAGLKWGNEAIASYSQYFHLAAWMAPTAQTVWTLMSGGVAGDPIAGVCTVAPEGIRIFILSPLLMYLLLGTTFLLAGFVSLFRIRSVIKRQPGAKADKLEKLMIRIGVFSVLYTVPASAVLACYLYETTLRNDWLSSLACPCKPRVRPLYSIVMLKYFMALAVGITSGVWIWSGKTIDSWRRLWNRLFGRNIDITNNITGTTGTGILGNITNTKGIINRSLAPQYSATPGPGSTLLQQSSVTSASQHHIHHHVLKQPPLSHV
ncbi:PREDICTED: frizzled-2-like [Ceratosolen solmsi marchali]|uniref:Frizzled-2-like n=1 Tax=Ceratosolen solmsi marchali TaxID=326594 RepID=A0AAJ6YW01_9HYME|nr:PREDICTED: frizzled-2-like [Ceratosolen solmsi marchali]